MKPIMYYWLFIVDFIRYKRISNKQENGVSESSEYIFIRWKLGELLHKPPTQR